jgi:uncharacterized protein (DUF433 family)
MAQSSRRIVRDDAICGGNPTIEGRRLTVSRIYALVEGRNLPPEEVAQKFDLDVRDVEAALEYYEANPDVIEEIEQRQEALQRRAEEAGMKDIDEYRPTDE